MRFFAILATGLFMGFFVSYVFFFHSIPPWMLYFFWGGLVGSVLGILLLPGNKF